MKSNGMTGSGVGMLLGGFLAILTSLVVMSSPGAALARAGSAPGGVTTPSPADAPVQSQIQEAPPTQHPHQRQRQHQHQHQQLETDDLSRSYPLPVLLTIIIGTTALVTAIVNVFVAPWTMRSIAADQREVADKAANAAVSNAAAASENARAAGKSAEAAVLNATAASRNSVNAGVHQVARLRQEWINDLRDELAALHSLLSNWQPPATGSKIDAAAAAALQDAHDTRVRDANTRLARVEMMLNPRELESRQLVAVLRFLSGQPMTLGLRRRRARWIVRWGQVVLKTEWDRVRSELNGTPVASPRRRIRSLKVLSAAPFRAGEEGAREASPSPSAPKRATRRSSAPTAGS